MRAVDSTGAGDAFAAGLAVGLAWGMTLRGSCSLVNVVAGLKVGRRGSSVAMPSWDDVRSRLGELR
ncbi:MAG: carbohydrate kinase family protein [Candidatus Korarchaeota archaeon]|nr:carbohydrate kinase family protein [Candidatus Korarchaeota archaeon]